MENKPKKQRTEAQKAADKRYRSNNPNRERNLQFGFKKKEADSIEEFITATGLSKVDFLRQAVKNYKPQD